MLRLLKQEDIAILLVSELASCPGSFISLAHIAKLHSVSMLFLKKLALRLREAGLIESKEGVGGGYRLARAPASISVLDVMEAVQQEKSLIGPKRKTCPLQTHCLPQTIKKTLGDTLTKSLQTISLRDLIHDEKT